MVTSLEEKRMNRFLLLRKLYEITNGVAERHLIDIREVGKELGMEPNVALDTFQYLKEEGLTKWMALGGEGTITHWGIKEVEDAIDQKPTALTEEQLALYDYIWEMHRKLSQQFANA